jgi:hypothetical protein
MKVEKIETYHGGTYIYVDGIPIMATTGSDMIITMTKVKISGTVEQVAAYPGQDGKFIGSIKLDSTEDPVLFEDIIKLLSIK